ncbi:MAG: tetratricopeptide repeat protein [Candidatus Krumholzibacteriia bacterium]
MRATLIFLAAGLLALAGCAPQFDRIEEGVLRNGQEIERLQREQALLRQQVEAIDSLLRFDQDAGKTADARGSAKLGHLSQKIDQLIQKLDDNASFTRNLSARVDLLATRAGVPPLGAPAGAAAAGELPEEGRALFQAALRDRSRGETDLARQGFREFLDRHGQSELADDARYWLAELDYADGRFAEALAGFQSLLAAFPATELAPAAELKIGYCQFSLGQEAQARETLARLIASHPDAEEAALARERLATRP